MGDCNLPKTRNLAISQRQWVVWVAVWLDWSVDGCQWVADIHQEAWAQYYFRGTLIRFIRGQFGLPVSGTGIEISNRPPGGASSNHKIVRYHHFVSYILQIWGIRPRFDLISSYHAL